MEEHRVSLYIAQDPIDVVDTPHYDIHWWRLVVSWTRLRTLEQGPREHHEHLCGADLICPLGWCARQICSREGQGYTPCLREVPNVRRTWGDSYQCMLLEVWTVFW
jgi:hypothetical protein